MKNVAELMTLLDSGAQPAVEFGAKVVDKESYAEKGMRARILRAARTRDDMVTIMFKFDEFDAHNKPLESANYYDKGGKPCLTAREAGFFKPEEEIYFGSDEDLDDLLVLVADNKAKLFQEYIASGSSSSYVSWLEDQVLASKA